MARLQITGITLQPEKCEFLRRELAYLGYIFSEKGVRPDPRKVKAVKEFPVPINKKNVKQLLGLLGYYHRFVPNFAQIAKPLTRLLEQDVPFHWSDGHHGAFEKIKTILTSEPLLHYPDFKKNFIVTTDASDFASEQFQVRAK